MSLWADKRSQSHCVCEVVLGPFLGLSNGLVSFSLLGSAWAAALSGLGVSAKCWLHSFVSMVVKRVISPVCLSSASDRAGDYLSNKRVRRRLVWS